MRTMTVILSLLVSGCLGQGERDLKKLEGVYGKPRKELLKESRLRDTDAIEKSRKSQQAN